jgi:putative ABC transport system permease protein
MDINNWNLLLGFSSIAIPVYIFRHYRLNMNSDLLISITRMVVQLFLVAVYLEWIFDKNSAWINSAWVLIMVIISAGTVVKRVKMPWKVFFAPLFLGSFVSIVIIDSFFIGFVIRPDYFFDARYFVPISGMILGNSLNHTIVGLTSWHDGLLKKKELYYFLLTNGQSKNNAMRPFIQEAIQKAMNPLIATMSVMGLISLPGMMTGQILGGASPAVAIKYQVMIMLAIFVGCILTLTLSINFAKNLLKL